MSMVVVADGRNLTSLISINCWFIVSVIVTMLVAVMPEMCSLVCCVFQCIANTHRCSVSSVQREHDGKNKSEVSAHGSELYHK
ncbi:MAG: hypothetical protein A2143_03350 [Gallionellales bacterium RBG_16_57_15]|nr:MAG: hypothetical protein A2143_03350 [Gallionellales bacterium RBG_16_57_15]